MKILLHSSPTYTDDNAVGSWLKSIVDLAGGEIVTVALKGGASDTARRIIDASPDSGLEWEMWSDTVSGLDEIIYLWQWPEYDESFVDKAHELGIPILSMGDRLSSDR